MAITAPQNLRATAVTQTTLTLAWDPPTTNNAAYYKLFCDWNNYSPPGTPSPQGVTTTETTLYITGLVSYRQCRCYLWAFDADNNVSPLLAIVVYTLKVVTPTNFHVISRGINTLEVGWDGGGEGVTYYQVKWNGYKSNNIPYSSSSYQIINLTANTTYNLELIAYGDGSVALPATLQTSTTKDPANLPAPTGLYAINRTSTSVTFGWSAVELATLYHVFYSTDPNLNNTFEYFGAVPGTQATVTGLISSKTYYLRVAAENSYGRSPTSGAQPGSNYPLSITTLAMLQTTGFRVSNVTHTTADFAWDTNLAAHHYKLVVTTSGGGYYETRFTSSAIYGTSVNATSLLPGYQHTATLWSYPTSEDAGGSWTEITFNTAQIPPPENLRFVSGTATSVQVAWNSSDVFSIGSYSLTIAGPGLTSFVANTFSTGHTFTQSSHGIQPSQYYRVAVRAIPNTVGSPSAYSEEVLTYSGIVPVPAVPSNLRQTASNTTSLSCVWDVAADATFYEIFRNGTLVTQTESNSVTLSGLQEQMSYSIQVRGCNFQKQSALSSPVIMMTQSAPVAIILQSPSHLATSVTLPTNLSWSPSPTIENVTSYDIQVATDSGFSNLIVNNNLLGSNIGSFLTSALLESSEYYWRVKANNSLGSGQWSETRSFYTIELPPSAPVRQFPESGNIVGLGVVFTWTAGIRASEHRLVIARDAQFQLIVREIVGMSGSTTSRYIILPDPNQVFYWKVGAFNDGGEAWSNTGMVYTENVVINLPAPTGLTVSDITPTVFSYTARLSWASVADAINYTVYYNDGVQQNTITAPAVGGHNAPAVTLNISRPGRNITAWIVAHGTSGQSSPSVSTTVMVAAEKSVDNSLEIVNHNITAVTIKLKNLRGEGVTSNDIYYRTEATDVYVTSIVEPEATTEYYEATLSNLLVLHNATYTIKRIAKFSNGDIYTTSSVTTLTPPEAPIIMNTIAGNNNATVTWSAVSGASKYYVYIDGRYRMTALTNSATLNDLPNGMSYNITVGGYNNAGMRYVSAPGIAIPSDLPMPPAIFNGSYNHYLNTVELTWSAVQNASGYKIYYKTGTASTWNGTGLTYNGTMVSSPVDVNPTTALSAILSDLIPHTVYYFGIASKSNAGEAGAIKALDYNITGTDIDMPPGVINVTGAPFEIKIKLDDGQIIIMWSWV